MTNTTNVEIAIAAIRNHYGPGSILRLGANEAMTVETLSTGSLAIDAALGGGLPLGRIIEAYGPESSGKTTFCLSVIAEAQRKGGTCAIIDVEHALDPSWARRCGVNVDALYCSQPDSGEDALNIAEILIRSAAVDVVVVDSVAALTTKAELDGQMGDAVIGAQARLMSQAMRRLTAAIAKTKCILIFTNQLREKIGVMFGSPEVTPGGRALKFFASVRLDIRRKDQLKSAQGTYLGSRVKVKVVKNKIAAPFAETEIDLMVAEGVSQTSSLIDLGVDSGVLEKRGAFIAFDNITLGQGRDAAKEFLKTNAEVRDRLDRTLRALLLAKSPIAISTQTMPAAMAPVEEPVVPAAAA